MFHICEVSWYLCRLMHCKNDHALRIIFQSYTLFWSLIYFIIAIYAYIKPLKKNPLLWLDIPLIIHLPEGQYSELHYGLCRLQIMLAVCGVEDDGQSPVTNGNIVLFAWNIFKNTGGIYSYIYFYFYSSYRYWDNIWLSSLLGMWDD